MAISSRIKKAAARSPKAEKAAPDYGTMGAPINRAHPFYFGFIATLGALTAIVLMRALASVSQIFVLILIALFLATGLNPAVEALRNEGANIKGMAAIFTYGFPVSKERFEAANLDVYTLSNYENLLEKAVDKQYVSENELETLSAWNANPAEWNTEG